MNGIAIEKRILLQNLVVHMHSNRCLLINLFSFRRTFLSLEDLKQLQDSSFRITAGNLLSPIIDRVYYRLCEEKQILDSSIIERLDAECQQAVSSCLGPVTTILINLSFRCNMSCGYCYQKFFPESKSKVSVDDIPKIHHFVSEYNQNIGVLKRVVISGGEPLLKENVSTINRIMNEFSNCEFEIYTNGTNILKYSNQIDFGRFSEVQISLDGFDSVISKISKGIKPGVFDEVISGVKYLMSKGCKIMLICMMTHGISNWLRDFLDDLSNRGIFDGKVQMRIAIPIINYSNEIVDENYFSYDEYLHLKSFLKECIYSNSVFLDTLPSFFRLKTMIYRDRNTQFDRIVRVCKSDRKTPLAFGPNGNIYWCSCEYPDNGIIGNYVKNEIYDTLLNDISNRNIFSIEKCRHCDMRYICATGCPNPLSAAGKNVLLPACRELDNEFYVDRMEAFVL